MKHQLTRTLLIHCRSLPLVALLAVGILFSNAPAYATIITHSWSGNFSEFDTFGGGTGVEGGSFSGTFSYDSLTPDQAPGEPLAGVYEMLDWSIDIFFDSGVLADQLSPIDGGTGSIYVYPDPVAAGVAENLILEIVTPMSGSQMVFGGFYTLPSITTTALPLDMSNAVHTDGLLGFIAGDTVAATFIEDSSVAAIPEPSSLVLLGLGLVICWCSGKSSNSSVLKSQIP